MILRGVIHVDTIGHVDAIFEDKTITTEKYPDGFSFMIDELAWAKHEATGEIVVSPKNGCTIIDIYTGSPIDEELVDGPEIPSDELDDTLDPIIEGSDEEIDNNQACLDEFGISWFKLVDLLYEQHRDEVHRLIDNAIAAREYEAVDD